MNFINAMKFTITRKLDGKLFTLQLSVVDYDDFSVLDARYKDATAPPEEKWQFLRAEELDVRNMTDEATTIAEVNRCLDIINNKIEEVFGVVEKPDMGVPLVKWLLASQSFSQNGNEILLNA